ncbi:flavin monoamine oxidase family protein [Cryobacterium tagatosivorans]|nr:NAD(P)/FAD-dependent oxidoreductase [Cryobacterium tagatosivorans]
MKRRTFLIGSASGLSIFALAACTSPSPVPSLSPTPSVSPSPWLVPRPQTMRRTTWSKDPFARGSMSFTAVGATPADRSTLATPIQDRVFFAGEATSVDLPGTVQGARDSGRRAAREVLALADPGERIAVVGAGMAGITAARMLRDGGYDVVVIEARKRVGGRIATVSDPDWPFPIELGPSFVRSSSASRLDEDLRAAGVTTLPVPAGTETRAPGGAVVEVPTVGSDAVVDAIAWAAGQPQDVSVAQALVESGAADLSDKPGDTGVSEADWLDHTVVAEIQQPSGAESSLVSAWYAPRDPAGEDTPDDGTWQGDRIVLGGYATLLTEAAADLDLLASSAVRRIAYTDEGVSLRLETGESLGADRVIVTVPLGVLKTDALEFAPPLPFEHRGAIAALGMGLLDKIWLRFEKPFWDADSTLWSVVGGDSGFQDWVNLEPLTGEAVLMGVVAADDAIRLAKLGDDDFLAEALASLEPFALPAPEPDN